MRWGRWDDDDVGGDGGGEVRVGVVRGGSGVGVERGIL